MKVVSCYGLNLRQFLDFEDREVDGASFVEDRREVSSDDTYLYPLPAKIKPVKSRGKKVKMIRK